MFSLLTCRPPWPSILAVIVTACAVSARFLDHEETPELNSERAASISSTSAISNDGYVAAGKYAEQSSGQGRTQILPQQDFDSLREVQDALELMQSEFFQVWLGDWPAASDWTGAVMGTYLSAALISLTKSANYSVFAADAHPNSQSIRDQMLDNLISKYFSQTTAYYFGENAISIRTQAYDDMLWVVVGWLESIKFMNTHDALHYKTPSSTSRSHDRSTWHGKQFEPAFAHRSHVFYEIVTRGWDNTLCGGGLTWNPSLEPYKNTITNTLFISASVAMYLYHPGDSNREPFIYQSTSKEEPGLPRARPRDPKYLAAAINGYDWLLHVNLTNRQGLFVDGYHVHDYRRNGTSCDLRNEMVYTYNQGVLLSGLRGLWESTGNLSYLRDGHKLVHNVIAATGWNPDAASSVNRDVSEGEYPTWRGLGRHGILQEFCDPGGYCSQDAQTFKGIFFHHLTTFCEPLPTEEALIPGTTFLASPVEATLHAQSCKEYTPWVARNAKAAMDTRNGEGLFGMWWGARRRPGVQEDVRLPSSAVDVRNYPEVLEESRWRRPDGGIGIQEAQVRSETHGAAQRPTSEMGPERALCGERDYNDRGRGRTVETQGGGLMVLRALWELLTRYGA